MKKPQRMGDNPLDMLMTSPEPEEAPTRVAKRKSAAGSKTKDRLDADSNRNLTRGVATKAHATFHLSVEVVEEARDTVSALAGPPLHLTLAELVERALRAELVRLRKHHNGGEPFPKRRVPIRSGRPMR